MRGRKGILRGPKVSSKHSTTIEAAGPIIMEAKGLPEVTKVALGEVARVKGGSPRIKFSPIRAGWRITVRGRNIQQTLFVYTKDADATRRSLETAWGKSGYA